MQRDNKSMFWSCFLLCTAVILYSVLRVLPFADQQQCATASEFKELKGKQYILSAQLDSCKQSQTSNFNEMNKHYTARLADCQSLYSSLENSLQEKKAKTGQMNTLCDENVCQNELAECKKKQVESTVDSILSLVNL